MRNGYKIFLASILVGALVPAQSYATCFGTGSDGVVTTDASACVDVADPDPCCTGAGTGSGCPVEECDTNGDPTDCCSDACTFETTSFTCRTSSGICDPAETCDGTSDACPADGKSTAECRPAAGVCDTAETCDGASNDCPSDTKSTAECRASAGICDTAETCDGASNDCPSDTKSTAECRASAGICDTAETCDGASDDCPSDVKSSGECRAAGGICDVAESCDGASDDCPSDTKSTDECRAAAGVCDTAETCDGVSNNCPSDTKSTDECRSSAGICDTAETCDGASNDCPSDTKSTSVCRAAVTVCDVAESCDGAGDDCPADDFAPTSTVCRDAVAICDQVETCSGTGSVCPSDAPAPTSKVCRVATGTCDLVENCDGAGACPTDSFASSTLACGSPSSSECDNPDRCDGAGHCDTRPVAGGTSCGSRLNDDCTDPDTCDGSGNCQNNNVSDGTACEDFAFCNGTDTCSAGACTVHTGNPCAGADGDNNCRETCNESQNLCNSADPDGSACNVGDGCTVDAVCRAGVCSGDNSSCLCGDAPETVGCVTAGKVQFAMSDTGDVTKNSMKWSWTTGGPVNPAKLGTPNTTTLYALCVYDRTGNTPTKVASFTIFPGSEWEVTPGDPGAVKFTDKQGLSSGITSVKGKATTDPGKSKMQLKAKGVNLVLPPTVSLDEWFDMDPSLTVQLLSDAGGCWTSDFAFGTASKNTTLAFSATGP